MVYILGSIGGVSFTSFTKKEILREPWNMMRRKDIRIDHSFCVVGRFIHRYTYREPLSFCSIEGIFIFIYLFPPLVFCADTSIRWSFALATFLRFFPGTFDLIKN